MEEHGFVHKSVLLYETVGSLNIKPGGIYVDGTLGRAGHSREIARRLTTGRLICIDRDEAKLPEGSVFIADLIGCRALDEDGAELGRIEDVLTMPSSDVYVIAGEKRYMVPAVREFVREIRVDEGYVRLHLIEGMAIDEN